MTGRLEGKVAIITGGSSGMGRATVDRFLQEGAKVVVGDIQDDRGSDMMKELGKDFSYIRCDVSSEDDIKNMVAHAVEKFGKLDVLFNNAGFGGAQGKIQNLDRNEVDKTISVLLTGVIMGYKYAAPHMIKQKSGSIISTASAAGLVGGLGPIVYATCKAAVIHWAKCASLHLAKDMVRSNTILPGSIATPVFSEGMNLEPAEADLFASIIEENIKGYQPMPRAGVGLDIANAALFLASDESSFVTGQALAVDGALTAGSTEGIGKRIDYPKVMREFEEARAAKRSS